jgi:hypothetical protein
MEGTALLRWTRKFVVLRIKLLCIQVSLSTYK